VPIACGALSSLSYVEGWPRRAKSSTSVSQSFPVGAGVLDFDSLYQLFLNSPSTALQTEIQHPLAYLVTKLVYQG
jgi:hypothetical protein